MNEVWQKPPISLADYQAMVGREVGISSWHLVDQPRIDVFAEVIEDTSSSMSIPGGRKRKPRSAPRSRTVF
jgi:hypothetical protein